jgi:hypothetical protein
VTNTRGCLGILTTRRLLFTYYQRCIRFSCFPVQVILEHLKRTYTVGYTKLLLVGYVNMVIDVGRHLAENTVKEGLLN